MSDRSTNSYVYDRCGYLWVITRWIVNLARFVSEEKVDANFTELVVFRTFLCFIPESTSLTVFASFAVGLNLLATLLITIFVFIWFLLGCIWVFGAHQFVQFENPLTSNYCQPVLYKCSFALLILTIFWAFLQCCLSCFRLCCIGQSSE